MNEPTVLWLSLSILIFGTVGIVAVFIFGLMVFNSWRRRHIADFENLVLRILHEPPRRSTGEAARLAADSLADYRERRNEFWTTYGQVALSVFIVTVLTILLLTKTIEADAGLPILSGIAGFAIAKTVSTGKTRSEIGPPGEREG
jgi:hypothetical protein